jgi:hypothetical protein
LALRDARRDRKSPIFDGAEIGDRRSEQSSALIETYSDAKDEEMAGVTRSPGTSNKPEEREGIDPMTLPPREHNSPKNEPEQAPRWLHFVAGLVMGLVLGAACSNFLWRRFGIAPMNTVAISSLVLAAGGAVLRGKLWRWMKL